MEYEDIYSDDCVSHLNYIFKKHLFSSSFALKKFNFALGKNILQIENSVSLISDIHIKQEERGCAVVCLSISVLNIKCVCSFFMVIS